MKLSAILAPMIAAGVPGNVILDTVRAYEDEAAETSEQGKEKARERWRRWKNKQSTNVGKRLQTDTNVSSPLTRVEDSSSNKEDRKEEKKERAAPKALSDLSAFKADLERDATPEQVDAFAKHRKAKNGQNSSYAATLFRRDAAACQMTVSEAIDTALSRGWLTVKPEYLAGRQATAPPQRQAPAETVGSLSKRQLFRQGNDDAPDNSTGRVVQIDSGRLEGGPGSPRSFAVSGNLLGRI
jgi:hypothetical protein